MQNTKTFSLEIEKMAQEKRKNKKTVEEILKNGGL